MLPTKPMFSSLAHVVGCMAFVAMLLPAPSWADRPPSTPGVPPQAEQKGFHQGVVAVSSPLAADSGSISLPDASQSGACPIMRIYFRLPDANDTL